MTTRFSHPSDSLGVNRFKVWPLGADPYAHLDLAANFDKSDAMIGIPSGGGAWPPTEGIDGGIYREIKLLQNERLPIGSIIAWWRPNAGIAIPTGYAVCDGSTLVAAQHDFAGGGSIVLPDLRNRFILGADQNYSIGTASAAVGAAAIDAASGAPGLGYTSGSNQAVLALTQIAAHDHGGGDHNHGGGSHTHTITDPGHNHIITDPGHSHSIPSPQGGYTDQSQSHGFVDILQDTQQYYLGTQTSKTNITIKGQGTGITISPAAGIIATSGAIIASAGGGLPHENRPRYIGLIFLMKLKLLTTL